MVWIAGAREHPSMAWEYIFLMLLLQCTAGVVFCLPSPLYWFYLFWFACCRRIKMTARHTWVGLSLPVLKCKCVFLAYYGTQIISFSDVNQSLFLGLFLILKLHGAENRKKSAPMKILCSLFSDICFLDPMELLQLTCSWQAGSFEFRLTASVRANVKQLTSSLRRPRGPSVCAIGRSDDAARPACPTSGAIQCPVHCSPRRPSRSVRMYRYDRNQRLWLQGSLSTRRRTVLANVKNDKMSSISKSNNWRIQH